MQKVHTAVRINPTKTIQALAQAITAMFVDENGTWLLATAPTVVGQGTVSSGRERERVLMRRMVAMRELMKSCFK